MCNQLRLYHEASLNCRTGIVDCNDPLWTVFGGFVSVVRHFGFVFFVDRGVGTADPLRIKYSTSPGSFMFHKRPTAYAQPLNSNSRFRTRERNRNPFANNCVPDVSAVLYCTVCGEMIFHPTTLLESILLSLEIRIYILYS